MSKSKNKREREDNDDEEDFELATARTLVHIMQHLSKVVDRLDGLSDNMGRLIKVVEMMNIVLVDLAKNHIKHDKK